MPPADSPSFESGFQQKPGLKRWNEDFLRQILPGVYNTPARYNPPLYYEQLEIKRLLISNLAAYNGLKSVFGEIS